MPTLMNRVIKNTVIYIYIRKIKNNYGPKEKTQQS